MDSMQEFLETKRMKEAAKKANMEKSAANSKRKLESIIQKKCLTIMIGALAKFEDRFGYLWGHGKKYEDLSREEKEVREFWDILRTEVLNNGNNQLRGIKEELAHYRVEYEGYKLLLPMIPKKEN